MRCAGIADARGTVRASDSLLVQTTGPWARRVLAVGTSADLQTHPAWSAVETIDLPGRVVAPALVNAHAHLDLTHLGPRPLGGGFAAWIDMVRRCRHAEDADIAASVRQGVALLRQGGTAAVGDIAGSVAGAPSLAPARALDEAGMAGVSYLEFFALSPDGSPGLDRALERAGACEPARIGLGLEPHAPYSASPGAYRRALATGLPVCTHLAESLAERELVGRGAGPIRDMLAGLGLWSKAVAGQFGAGRSPVAHLEGLLDGVLAVHLNDLGDADVAMLASSGARVAYCPRASAYFGAPEQFGPHRYRDLLDAGVPVALGTDSVINLPAGDVQARGICVLDEARLLLERDGVDPDVLLAMLYRHGPGALGLGEQVLAAGSEVLGLIAVEASGDAGRGLVASTGPISFL
jgi:cytosine/adenosine deaminase-related metal-dependent hydrolase